MHTPLTRIGPRDIFTCTLFKKIKDIKYPAPDLVTWNSQLKSVQPTSPRRTTHRCVHEWQVGFDQFPDLWLVGYGLDSNGTKRGWPHVYGVPKVRTDITVET